jgi:crotonobetainyl-CoA:carnitine CoA-transferase CaiB-like acyl-CoA transferase
MSSLLDGIRVIESASLLNGDRLGTLLGDLGADVVKVESPGRGDYLRDFLGQIAPHHSPAHVQVNKQKRSVTIDLRQDRGKEVFWRLLRTTDVFVDGNAADATASLGISYDDQRRLKADIIYCQCSGFGARGPYAPIPTHGQMMSALAGALPVRMGDDGLVHLNEDRPRLYPMGGGDGTATAAVYAAMYVASAIVHRDRTGRGCFIDVAAVETVMHNNWLPITNHVNADRITDRSTMPVTGGGDGAKYQFYETKDHKFVLFCGIEHKFWDHFCRAVGRDDLVDRKDTAAPVDFAGGAEDLRRELQTIFSSRTLDEWTEEARIHDIAMGPVVNDADGLRHDPHLSDRGIFVDGHHPHAGPFTYLREAAIVDGDPYVVRRPAPLLGEHTDEILAELGYADGEREALRATGTI